MKYKYIFFILISLLYLQIFGLVFEFNNSVNNIDIINNESVLIISLNRISVNKENEFLKIEDFGFGYTNKTGYPALPAIRVFVDFNEIFYISIKDSFIIELKQNERIYPFPKSIRKTESRSIIFLDTLFYNNPVIYPDNFYNIKFAAIKNNKNKYLLELYPVKWDMINNRLIIYTEIEINHNRVYYDFYKPLLIPEGYLILLPSDFENHIIPFINMKTSQGYNVKYVFIDTLIDNTKETIKNVIEQFYNNSTFNLNYVLLIGDTSLIPCYKGTELDFPPTDLYYSLMDTNDYFPDIGIGRFSVEDTIELKHIVMKNIIYQNGNWQVGDIWIDNAYFMATDDPSFHLLAEGTHNYAIEKLRSINMNVDSLYYFYNTGTPVSDAINNGRGIVVYSGHGNEVSWAGPPFSQTNIRSLLNYQMYPFIFSFACLTGDYAYSSECFGETWVRTDSIGGVGYMGSSVYSYWYEDDVMERALINAYVDSSYIKIADMIDYSKRIVYAAYSGGGFSKRYFEMYNILGDPSLDLFSNIIGNLEIVSDTFVPLNDSIRIYITSSNMPVNNANIAVIYNDSLMFYGNSDNEGYFAFENIFSINDTVFVYVTKHNYRYDSKYIIIKNINYYPDIISMIYNDTINYYITPDSMFSVGDSGYLQFDIKNLGYDTIFALSCSLKIKDSILNTKDTVFYIAQLPPQNIYTTIPIIASIDMQAADNDYIEIEYVLFDTLSNMKRIIKYFPIKAPDLEYIGKILYNTELSGGDTAKFSIELKNKGSLDAKDISITFNPSNNMIIDSGIINYLSIDSIIVSDTFLMKIPDTITEFNKIYLDILISDALNRQNTFSDSFIINRMDYLVIDYDLNNNSGPIIDSLLNILGYTGDYKTTVNKGELINYKNIFLTRGVYPDNTFISAIDDIALALDSLLKAGKINMYMEGGECWYYDISLGGFSFNETFGINGIADNEFFSGNIFGVDSTWLEDMDFVYSGDSNYLDVIEANGGKNIFIDDNAYYGVCYDGGNYRTVGLSFELGGLNDSLSNTKEELLSRIMDYFNRLLNTDEFFIIKKEIFKLISITPNPFFNTPEIKFISPSNTNVNIRIYDIMGRRVFSKNMNIENSGIYSIKWNNSETSGIYFLIIDNGNKVFKTKLIKLR